MRFFKLAVLSFVILFAIITVFSLFIPSNVRISRAIDITARQQNLLPLLQHQQHWKKWNPPFMNDSTANTIEVRIVASSDTLIISEWKQGTKPPLINGWQVHTMPGANTLTLQWYMDFKLQWYPWKKFESLFFDKVYGAMMQEGLQNIKARVEGQ